MAGRQLLAAAHANDPGPHYALFQAVDADNSNAIDAKELQKALSTSFDEFDIKTIKLMMNIFDRDRSGTVGPGEFEHLWGYLEQWKKCFDSYDTDKGGSLDVREVHNALTSIGYRVSGGMFDRIRKAYDEDGGGTIGFDEFIQMCVDLQNITAQFAAKDLRRQGKAEFTLDELAVAISVVH